MVDLGFGLITASLPVLVGLLPRKPKSSRQASNPARQDTAGDSVYLRSTTQTTVVARHSDRASRFADSDSDLQGILVQDEIELISHHSSKKFEE